MRKTLIIAKREYVKVIRKPAFWISTLFIPIFIIVISLMSGFSSTEFQQKIKNGADNAKTIFILDQSNYIHFDKIVKPFERINDVEKAKAIVRNNEADALIYIASDFDKTRNIEVYEQDKGLFLQSRFNSKVSDLIKDSILSELNDQQKKNTYNANYKFNITSYKNGEVIIKSIQNLVIPGISLILYFILTTFATSYLLLSVAEEKENRIMEIILSTVKPKELITGKIIGLIGIIITQVLFLIIFSIVGLVIMGAIFSSNYDIHQLINSVLYTKDNIKFININLVELLLGLFYTFTGFFILACTMVGVGSAMPTYKEAQGLSSIFIMISVLPFYFITIILADPAGSVSQVFSYIPFTANFVLLFRNALGALTLPEIIISIVVLIVYSYIALVLAFKLFEVGSLEYSKRITLKTLFNR